MNKYEANPRVNFFDGANGIMTSIIANYVPGQSQLGLRTSTEQETHCYRDVRILLVGE